MALEINRKLHLVIPVITERGPAFLHSTSLSRVVFEEHFKVLAAAFAAVFAGGLSVYAGPQAAYLTLKDTAQTLKRWDDIQAGVINEIIRLSNLAVPGPKGYEQVTLDDAIRAKLIDDDTRAEALSELVFFTLVVLVMKKTFQEPTMRQACGLTGSEITYSGFTDYMGSLPTSTETETTSESPTPAAAAAPISATDSFIPR